jgi:thiol-disulfide isomerase/thioredoxin
MRRVLALVLVGLLGLTACAKQDQPNYPDAKLIIATPDLVKLKKTTDVPDCPKVSGGAVSGGLPAITLGCLGGGRSVDLASLRGPMIVNFWATSCGPCRREMPALAAFAKSQSDVRVLGVDYLDVQPAAALQLAAKSHVAYPLVADPKGVTTGQGPILRDLGMPFTMFLDASGKVVHLEAGPYESEHDVAAAAARYLGVGG